MIYKEKLNITDKHNLGNLEYQNGYSICWLKNPNYYHYFNSGFLLLKKKDLNNKLNPNIKHIIVKNPRLEYAKLVQKHFSHLGLVIHNEVEKHRKECGGYIGDNVYIGENVILGRNITIFNNVVIHNNTVIGDDCIIKENVTIGSEGFGFERDEEELVKFPQIGGVNIGNRVEINTYSDIKRGTLSNTEIGDECKIGSYINIGHNVKLGKQCILTSQCVIAGSSKIGDRFFMGVNSSIKNGVIIGGDVTLGANSYINSNVPNKQKIIGISKQNKFTQT